MSDDEEVPLEFQCPVCIGLFVEPVTTACGHTFCRNCLMHSMDHRQLCPSCREPCTFVGKVNVALSSIILQRYPRILEHRCAELSELREREKNILSPNNFQESLSESSNGIYYTIIETECPIVTNRIFNTITRRPVVFPHTKRFVKVSLEDLNLARMVWESGSRICVLKQDIHNSGINRSTVSCCFLLVEILQIQETELLLHGIHKVRKLSDSEYRTSTDIAVSKFSYEPFLDDIPENLEELKDAGISCLNELYTLHLSALDGRSRSILEDKVGHLGVTTPSVDVMNRFTHERWEKESWKICGILLVSESIKFDWLVLKNTKSRFRCLENFLKNSGADCVLELTQRGSNPSRLRTLHWSLFLLIAVLIGLLSKFYGFSMRSSSKSGFWIDA